MSTFLVQASAEDVLDFIKSFQKAYPGVSPSYREIMKAFDIQSTGTVSARIEQLYNEGELEPYREFAGFRGLICSDTALLTKQELENFGVDWKKVKEIQRRNQLSVENFLDEFN